MTELTEYARDLRYGALHSRGVVPSVSDCVAWYAADATVDQALEWMNHGCGPGDYAGCVDKEGAWEETSEGEDEA